MQCKQCLSIVIAIMLAMLGIDVICGAEVSPWVAYAVPVAFSSRYCGFSTGATYAALAGGLLCVAARQSGHPYSEDIYFLIAVSFQTLALLVIAWLTARLSQLESMLRRTAARHGSLRVDR